MNPTMTRGPTLVWGPRQRNREHGWAAGVYTSVCSTHNTRGSPRPRMHFLSHIERVPCQAKRETSQCSPGTRDLHTASSKRPFRWMSSGSLSSRTFTRFGNELQCIVLSFPRMKKWWAGGNEKKWKSPFVFFASPAGPPFVRSGLDWPELPPSSYLGFGCWPPPAQAARSPALYSLFLKGLPAFRKHTAAWSKWEELPFK